LALSSHIKFQLWFEKHTSKKSSEISVFKWLLTYLWNFEDLLKQTVAFYSFSARAKCKNIAAWKHGDTRWGTTQIYGILNIIWTALYYCQWSGIQVFTWIKPRLLSTDFVILECVRQKDFKSIYEESVAKILLGNEGK
jgi:hypothetical protein